MFLSEKMEASDSLQKLRMDKNIWKTLHHHIDENNNMNTQ